MGSGKLIPSMNPSPTLATVVTSLELNSPISPTTLLLVDIEDRDELDEQDPVLLAHLLIEMLHQAVDGFGT
jgi:hypothetical protein